MFGGLHGSEPLSWGFSIKSVQNLKKTINSIGSLRFSGLSNFIKSVYGRGDVASTMSLVSKTASRSAQESSGKLREAY